MSTSRARHEIVQLTAVFVAWKITLLLIAYTSPGSGYDTSTNLLGLITDILPQKLTRWDAIYYTVLAQRGYVFEQEWAFGWGFTRFLKLCAQLLPQNQGNFPKAEAWSGIIVAHVAHLISVVALYDISELLFQTQERTSRIPYLASALHIFTPGGLFLSGPSAEALFSCLSMLGYNVFVRAKLSCSRGLLSNGLLLQSAILFGLATTVRSNGLLNGLLFVVEACNNSIRILDHGFSVQKLWQVAIIGISGLIIGLGSVLPQYIVYQHYCSSGADLQPWCTQVLPSIYSYVQRRYWGTGAFNYWTFGNLPLFAMAAPAIYLLTRSSVWAWKDRPVTSAMSMSQSTSRGLLRTIALPQLVLVVMILISYHVQIIIRLCSGYPVWYWWLAHSLQQGHGKITTERTIMWMVLYASVQGVLFAGFLPPA